MQPGISDLHDKGTKLLVSRYIVLSYFDKKNGQRAIINQNLKKITSGLLALYKIAVYIN